MKAKKIIIKQKKANWKNLCFEINIIRKITFTSPGIEIRFLLMLQKQYSPFFSQTL